MSQVTQFKLKAEPDGWFRTHDYVWHGGIGWGFCGGMLKQVFDLPWNTSEIDVEIHSEYVKGSRRMYVRTVERGSTIEGDPCWFEVGHDVVYTPIARTVAEQLKKLKLVRETFYVKLGVKT